MKIDQVLKYVLLRVQEKMQLMTMATIGSDQIAKKLRTAHLESFNLTRAVVFVGSTAVVTRVKESQLHRARGVLRLFVSLMKIFWNLGQIKLSHLH